jgi:hypothetical protein
MADGGIASQPRILVDLPIKFNHFDSVESFFVIDLDERWDLIIGMTWLETHQPWIDWRAKKIYKVTWLDDSRPWWIHRRSADKSSAPTTLMAMSNVLATFEVPLRSLTPTQAALPVPADPLSTAPPHVTNPTTTTADVIIKRTCNLDELPRTSSEIVAIPNMSFHAF